MKVLIVDDDQFLLDIYSVKFNESGIETETATGGEAALEKIQNDGFDVVLMDVVMPSMDGLTLLEKIHEEGLAGKLTLIVLSNQGQPEDIDKAKEIGIDGYIVKASRIPSEVLEEVRDIYQSKQPAK